LALSGARAANDSTCAGAAHINPSGTALTREIGDQDRRPDRRFTFVLEIAVRDFIAVAVRD